MVISFGVSVKPNLLPGDVGFLMHHDNWISKAFAWFMESKWSHSFLIHEVTDRLIYTSETSDFEVVIHCFDKYLEDPNCSIEVWRLEGLSEEKRVEIADLALKENLGQTYGYLQLFSLGLRRLLMRIGIKIPNFIRSGLVCCHHVLYGYTLAKIAGFEALDPEAIDTEEMYQKIKKKGFKKVFEKPRS